MIVSYGVVGFAAAAVMVASDAANWSATTRYLIAAGVLAGVIPVVLTWVHAPELALPPSGYHLVDDAFRTTRRAARGLARAVTAVGVAVVAVVLLLIADATWSVVATLLGVVCGFLVVLLQTTRARLTVASRELRLEAHRPDVAETLVARLGAIKYHAGPATAIGLSLPPIPDELVADALADTRRVGADVPRAAWLVALARQLPDELLPEALAVARTIGEHPARAEALAALASRLRETERRAVLAEAFASARAAGNDWDRARTFAALVPELPAELLPEALVGRPRGRRGRARGSVLPRAPAPGAGGRGRRAGGLRMGDQLA
jgi:hypothetical protein